MIKHIVIAAAVLSAAGSVIAEPASEASIERLLVVTKSEAMLDSMYSGAEQTMRQTMQQVLAGKTMTSEQQQLIDSVPSKFVALMRSEFTWQKMKPLYVTLYRETFSQDEIDGVTAFYESRSGQAFINKMPVVLQKSFAISQSQMQMLLPKMKAAIDEAVRDANLNK